MVKRKTDIIFVASPSKEQSDQAIKQQVNMVLTPIGNEAFVFFVNSKNPVNGLTSEQLRDIYSGRITNWNQVGGKNTKTQPFQRNRGSGSQTIFLKFMQTTPVLPATKENVPAGMGGIISQTANYANYAGAIGFSFRYFAQTMIANNEIKLLSIDGVYPTVETIKSGAYPLSDEFYAASLVDNPNQNTQKLLQWILSPQGQYLVEKTGYVAID